jgi:hypothetical protein
MSSNGKADVQLIGDKNPQYSRFIPSLLKIFPDAKFIFITRDHRDQVLSMMKVNFERRIVSSLAWRWKYVNRKIEQYRLKFPKQFCVLKYEDLVRDPGKELKSLCRFLQIHYAPEMLRTVDRALYYVSNNSALVKDHHRSLLQPIHANKIGLWKKAHQDLIKVADAVVGSDAEKFGYERRYRHTTMAVRLRVLPGIVYGRLYFVFLDFIDTLPYSMRMFIFKKITSKIFGFWRDRAEK